MNGKYPVKKTSKYPFMNKNNSRANYVSDFLMLSKDVYDLQFS